MDRFAVFVDAGYFFAAGAQAAFGKATPRKLVSLRDPASSIQDVVARSSAVTENLHVLRTYWYDAMPGAQPTLEQSSLAMLAGVKVRMGTLNNGGQQKGVDSLIVTDLIDLARNRAIADAVVVSGDEDLRIAVQVAQSFGVRVHVLAVEDPKKNVSPALQMEADSVSVLDGQWFREHLVLSAPATASPAVKPPACANGSAAQADIDTVAVLVANELLLKVDQAELARLQAHTAVQRTIPPEYDRPLIAKTSVKLQNRQFSGAEKRHIRGCFIRTITSVHSAQLEKPTPSGEES